ncbi:MAG: hypothetical protein IKU40_10260 [Clostridia bacterium]|nr:hypothetical protein [Clostridia bacterium]
MKKFLTLALAAILLACTPAAVLADDAISEEAVIAAEPLVLEGMTQVAVTTSDTSLDADVRNFYDAIPETKCTITFDAEAEEKIFSVYTATKVPEDLAKFAVILDGEKGSVVTVEVYGTNDSLLLDWTPLAFGPESLETEYAIFAMEEDFTRYAFYRFDFTLELGEYFDLAELALYKVTTDEPEMQYDLGEVVEEGEMPALIPVEEAIAEEITEEETAEEPAEEALFTEVPSFGLFSKYPMPVFKFLPRG